MTAADPQPDCRDILFSGVYSLAPSGEVALEDYARVQARARGAAVLGSGESGGAIKGVHLCGVTSPLLESAHEDVEAFARDLATRGDGTSGLGWS